MPQVYEGDRPYIFMSYAHADDDVVLPIIDALVAEGYRVWYDKGIEKGVEFPDYLANHVHDCACMVIFISNASKASRWCRREAYYALKLDKPMLPVYLEDVELGRGLQLSIGPKQAMLWHKSRSDDEFCEDLFGVRMLDPCLDDKGRTNRGVKRRGTRPQDGTSDAGAGGSKTLVAGGSIPNVVTESVSPVDLEDVSPKGALADYSWAELKALARGIAAQDNDAEGLVIARRYRLVGPDCRLRGDAKPLTLSDGTKASVRILGFRHDALSGNKGKAGITFEFASVPATHRMNPTRTNAGGWEACEMRKWVNTFFFAMLPDDMWPHVEAVKKLTNNVGEVKRVNDTSAVSPTEDRLWLLSMSEVYGRLSVQPEKNRPWSPATYDAEGTQYQLYSDKGVSTTNYDFCKKSGASSWWWLRSPRAYDSWRFRSVGSGGDWCDWHYADCEGGVSPGFCF